MRSIWTISTVKKMMEDADKKFTPRGNNTKTDPAFFRTRMYTKFLLANNKAIEKLEKGKNANYLKIINNTNGVYLNRKGGNVLEQVKAMASFCKKEIKAYPILEYSAMGTFVRLYETLTNNKWSNTFKAAYMQCRKEGDKKTLASSYKTLYISLVMATELFMDKLLGYQFWMYSGETPQESIESVHRANEAFFSKVGCGALNLLAFCDHVDPVKALGETVKEENNAKKSSEGFYENVTQVGKFLKDVGLKLIPFGALVGSGFVAFFGAAGVTASLPCAIGLWVLASLLIVPNIRMIIYHAATMDVDIEKQLEFDAELLNNNILELKRRLDETTDEAEKARLQRIIDKQQALYAKMVTELDERRTGASRDEAKTENDMDGDESSIENSLGEDDDEKNQDDDFDMSI